jgi:hypothetical protein
MAHTYEELSKMTVAQLREVASGVEHEAVTGHTQMHKQEILNALCTALGIEARTHHDVVGIDKTTVKARIKALKAKRDEAIASKDKKALQRLRHDLKILRHKIRKATV